MDNWTSIVNSKICIELPILKNRVYLPLKNPSMVYLKIVKILTHGSGERGHSNYQQQKKYRSNNLATCLTTANILFKPKRFPGYLKMCECEYVYIHTHTCTHTYTFT